MALIFSTFLCPPEPLLQYPCVLTQKAAKPQRMTRSLQYIDMKAHATSISLMLYHTALFASCSSGDLCTSYDCLNELGPKSCRTKVPQIFRIVVPNFAPNFAPNFPLFFEEFSCFVSWETETRKIHQKSPPFFNTKFPGKSEEKIHKVFFGFFWRAGGKVTMRRPAPGSVEAGGITGFSA